MHDNKKDIAGVEDFLWACALTDIQHRSNHRNSSSFTNDFEVKRHRILESKYVGNTFYMIYFITTIFLFNIR